MTNDELKKKLMDAGIVDDRVLAVVIFNLPSPDQIDEASLDLYLLTGGANELADVAMRSDFLNSNDQLGKKLVDVGKLLEEK